MRRRVFFLASVASLLLCLATLLLWILPIRPWPNHGRGTFFFSMEEHRVVRVNFFRTSASPVVSPPQEDTPAFVRWQMAIPAGPSFEFHGFRVAHYPWFKGSRTSDGHNFLTHVGTHWAADVPFLALVLLFAMLPAFQLLRLAWRKWLASSPAGCCIKCKYNLTGNTSGVCPECGTSVMTAVLEPIP